MTTNTFAVIAFDGDDTLWHNEHLYLAAQDKFERLLAGYPDVQAVKPRLYETEKRNIPSYGYGIKGFVLSMIETAVELTHGQIEGKDVQAIISFGKEMLQAKPRLFDHAAETVARLSESHPLMLITKGDLFDQETKVAKSGLASYFKHVQVVSDKTRETYQALLAKHNLDPRHFLMVGNSLRSDILPVLALGGQAVYIPYHLTWEHENEVDQQGEPSWLTIEHLGQLPELVEALSRYY